MKAYNGFSPDQRMAALRWARAQDAAGKRPPMRGQCDACGQTEGHLERHSEDYSAPYGPHIGKFVLCYRCHMMVHCRHRDPEKWDTYRLLIRLGFRFPPIQGRSWPRFLQEMLAQDIGDWPEPELVRQREGAPPTLLDEIHEGQHNPNHEGDG